MTLIERQQVAKQVVQFYTEISNFNKFETVSHFKKQGLKTQNLYKILRRYEETGTHEFKRKSGRKVTVATPEMINKVKKRLVNTQNTIRDTARTLGISKTRVQDIKIMMEIKTKKCQKIPKYTIRQEKRAKTNCRKIYRRSIGKVLILDDESYVKCDPKANFGHKYYHFSNEKEVPIDTKTLPNEKFPKKYLIWQALDEFGNISEPFIKIGTLTSEEYKKECIEKRLLPFIRKHHSIENVLFWPDLAPIHYSKCVQNCLNDNRIDFIKWGENAPAVPQARPIERFWSFCKREYSKRSSEPKGVVGFRQIWNNISKSVSQRIAQSITKGIRRKLKLIGDHGVYALFKT